MKLQIKIAWWLKYYLQGVALMCAITGRDYDEVKVGKVIDRALRAEVVE